MGTLGGKRPGAGRKKGTKSAATLEKEAVMAAFRQRAMKVADLLLDSQLTLARGQTFLYKIEKEWRGKGKSGYWFKKAPKLVTEQWEIEAFLEGEISSNEDDNDPGATYYFLTTKEPNNQAVDSILDRTFGKSIQGVELSGKDGAPIQIAGMKIIKE